MKIVKNSLTQITIYFIKGMMQLRKVKENIDEKRRSRIDSDTEEHKKHVKNEKKINFKKIKIQTQSLCGII